MRRAELIDLAAIDVATTDLPARNERLLRDAVVSGLALRLRASGARSWMLLAGTKRQTLGDATLIPLEVARRMVAAASAPSPGPSSPVPSAPLFGAEARLADVMLRYLASGENGRWKPGTLRNMRAVAAVHILPLLGQRKVRDITAEEVTRWHLDVAAKSTAARMSLSTLSGLMLYAEDHGLRDPGSNPCRGLRKKQRGHRGQLLPAAVVKRLWAVLDRLQERMPDACDAVRLLLLTGARRSEILGLAWDSIAGPRAVLDNSKTGPRTIWLNTPARAILDARKAKATSAFVFPSPVCDGPIKVIDRAWSIIREEADLGRLRVHDLRHHFASVAVSNGIDLRLVGQLLGHHDLDSTLGYAHLASDALMQSATRVSGLIDRALRGQAAATANGHRSPRKSKQRKPGAPTKDAHHG
ncbi:MULTISPECIES: site-specific integrase [unclassified Novosphingobium]|uniref:tyrosine-type recombinase/integrase n=1 Tax=unclassified Novosphingobium TaxID=2644732 RepID=UPI00146DF6EB|nr:MULTISPECIES: site-specific integrase [unclassified Novosphingobium]NMN06702.1 integrase [Novosphingobium sp. SG919]NMN88847.1 integrase [Novosphingobium sp. SG916]